MQLKVKHLGPLRQAEFELGDLTVICGKNNTGKTYATYALYGFLSFWEDSFIPTVTQDKIDILLNEGSLIIDLSEYIEQANKIIGQACKRYSKLFPQVFASSEKHFADTEYQMSVSQDRLTVTKKFHKVYGSTKKDQFSIQKGPNETLEVSLLLDRESLATLQRAPLQAAIGNAIKDIVFSSTLPHPFIASAERTGALFFVRSLILPVIVYWSK